MIANSLVYLFNKNYVTANYKIGKSVMKPSTKKKKKKTIILIIVLFLFFILGKNYNSIAVIMWVLLLTDLIK